MARLLLLFGAAVALFIIGRWVFRQPPRVIWQTLAVVLALGLLLLVLTGRAHWLAAVFAALLPFMRGILALLGSLPLLRRALAAMRSAKSTASPQGGQSSTVESAYIRMTLDHDSGEIGGEVLSGNFAGRSLARMSLDELLQLLRECQGDEDSVAMLQAYLDRVHGETWQQQAGAQGQRQSGGDPGEMSREEALQVLGLAAGASEEEIIEAHRRLMQKLHPDRGGSAYLAARINLAKDTLLGE